jgi:Family of unknown function (DUF6173)
MSDLARWHENLAAAGLPKLTALTEFPRELSETPAMRTEVETRRTRELLEEAAQANSAEGFVRRIHARMVDFGKGLDATQEVGIAMVHFGQNVALHVRALGYIEPGLIVFTGVTADGSPVQLIQHLHQISFLLMKVPVTDPDAPKRQIGFFSAEQDAGQS